jgi:hypothetical protein
MDEQTFEQINELANKVETGIAMAVMTERGIEYNQANWDAFWENAPNEPDAFWDSLMGARYDVVAQVHGEELYIEFMEMEYPEA